MIKAKKCPFCGDNKFVLIVEPTIGMNRTYYVTCTTCGSRGPSIILYGESTNSIREEMIEKWNERNYNG